MSKRLFSILILTLLLCVSAVQTSLAQGLPVVAPASVGMSAAKLNRIEELVNKDIADKKLPGAVVLVSDAVDVDMGGVPIHAMLTRFPADRMELVV